MCDSAAIPDICTKAIQNKIQPTLSKEGITLGCTVIRMAKLSSARGRSDQFADNIGRVESLRRRWLDITEWARQQFITSAQVSAG